MPKVCFFYRVIVGQLTIELKNTLVENHERRLTERAEENDRRSAENFSLAFYAVVCTLGVLCIFGVCVAAFVMIRQRCVKSATEKKARETLLKELVKKANDIERGILEDAEGPKVDQP